MPLTHTFLALATAFFLGGLIGFERQWRQRNAGLRTNVLVALGAAAFVDLGGRMAGSDGFVRVIAYVVSGIGFLGAGVIMKEGAQVRGLNTAATLWATAAVGAFAGCGQEGEAAMVTVFILAGNTLLRPLVDFINRRPINPDSTEALYRVHVICEPDSISDARDLLFELLEARQYPLREIVTVSESEDQVELAAVLVPTTADPKDLDAVVAILDANHAIESATWTVSTMN